MKMEVGVTRRVILIGRYAFKFPRVGEIRASYGWWYGVLRSLCANISEYKIWALCRGGEFESELCPVVFHIPGGFLNVMPRCDEATREDILTLDQTQHRFAEYKSDSWGWYHGKLVAIDYHS